MGSVRYNIGQDSRSRPRGRTLSDGEFLMLRMGLAIGLTIDEATEAIYPPTIPEGDPRHCDLCLARSEEKT